MEYSDICLCIVVFVLGLVIGHVSRRYLMEKFENPECEEICRIFENLNKNLNNINDRNFEEMYNKIKIDQKFLGNHKGNPNNINNKCNMNYNCKNGKSLNDLIISYSNNFYNLLQSKKLTQNNLTKLSNLLTEK